jgi:ribosomal protein S18 acetylase RimI-like enzyme
VRRLGPGDETILAHLAKHNDRFGSLEERVSLDPLPEDEAVAFLRDDRTATFVAFAGDEPVGFVYACEMYRRHTALRHLCIYEVGVSDRHRKQGIGPALLDAVGDHARAQGLERGFTITHTSNTAAMALFAEHGARRTADDDAVFAFDWS